MATLREARGLARRVWPGAGKVRTGHGRVFIESMSTASTQVEAFGTGIEGGVNDIITIRMRTRRAALAGLCAALTAMVEER